MNKMHDLLTNHRAEVCRALESFSFDRTDDGRIYLRASKTFIGGAFTHAVNGRDLAIDSNVMMFAGLDDVLKVYFTGSAQPAGFYLALFTANATPAQTLTAATFNSSLTEFTAYNEATRPAWAHDAEASQGIANAATPSVFTMSTGGPYTVWGAAMLTSAAKSPSTSGLLVCASEFAAARTLLQADILSLQYTITATDAG